MARIVPQLRLLVPFVFLSGCVSATTEAPPTTGTARPLRQSSAGLEGVMGRDAAALTRQFGTPALDVREGTARKLQFASQVCVLDAYLYPRSGGGQALVTHVDTRRPDGSDIDAASCVSALGLSR